MRGLLSWGVLSLFLLLRLHSSKSLGVHLWLSFILHCLLHACPSRRVFYSLIEKDVCTTRYRRIAGGTSYVRVIVTVPLAILRVAHSGSVMTAIGSSAAVFAYSEQLKRRNEKKN